jgi:hypothetical protein
MHRHSQSLVLVAIHEDYVVGVCIQMGIRFSDRTAMLDEGADEFLRRLAHLGGYCTVDQAQRMGLANSPTRVLFRLDCLERSKFLRRVFLHPFVYQITKAVTRLMGVDWMARRRHPIETARRRLLAVNFFLEASDWPTQFVLDHEEKIAAFRRIGCSADDLPGRFGRPYLWEDFVLDVGDGCLTVALVDRGHCDAFLQALTLVKRFADCRSRLGERLSVVVVVGSEGRHRLYSKAAEHPKVLEHCHGISEPLSAYKVSTPVPRMAVFTHESAIHSDNLIRGGHERP